MLPILSKQPFDVVCNLDLPDPTEPPGSPTKFYPAPAEVPAGVTVVTIRGLDYWDVVEVETNNTATDENTKKREHARGYLQRGVVAVNGDKDLGAQVGNSPHPRTALALYQVIEAASWGN